MYKFIYVYDIHGRQYLINVSQIIWIEYSLDNSKVLMLRFEDGSTLTIKYTKEIIEMLVLKPWWMNIYNAIKWLFRKKGVNK